jgi:hypothetical protein
MEIITTLLALLLTTVVFQGPLIIERRGASDVEIVTTSLTAIPSPQSLRKKRTHSPSLPGEGEYGIRDEVQGIAPKHNGAPEAAFPRTPQVAKQDVEVLVGVRNTGAKVITAIRWEFTVSDKIRKQKYEKLAFST